MKLPTRRQDRMIWLLAAFLFAAGVARSAPELPDGDGRQAVEQICTSCHSLEPIISARHTNAEWRAVVDDMASQGAQGTDDDFNAAVEYLSRHYGKSLNWPLCCAVAALPFGVWLLRRHRPLRRN